MGKPVKKVSNISVQNLVILPRCHNKKDHNVHVAKVTEREDRELKRRESLTQSTLRMNFLYHTSFLLALNHIKLVHYINNQK